MGETSRDILDYLSSREADQRIFKADLLVDRAHLVMLKEKGLISEEIYSKIISALDEIGEGHALGELERIFTRPLRQQSSTGWVRRGEDAYRPLSQ